MYKLIKIKKEYYIFTENDKIKDGDWCLLFDSFDNLFLCDKPSQYFEKEGHVLNDGLKKIIASTVETKGLFKIYIKNVEILLGDLKDEKTTYTSDEVMFMLQDRARFYYRLGRAEKTNNIELEVDPLYGLYGEINKYLNNNTNKSKNVWEIELLEDEYPKWSGIFKPFSHENYIKITKIK